MWEVPFCCLWLCNILTAALEPGAASFEAHLADDNLRDDLMEDLSIFDRVFFIVGYPAVCVCVYGIWENLTKKFQLWSRTEVQE